MSRKRPRPARRNRDRHNPTAPDNRRIPPPLRALAQQPECAVAAATLACLALLAHTHIDLTGHDYGYFLPKMLDTQAFYLKNGLALQEYTAALCAGVFQFANPQSMALALPQALSFLFGPRFGIQATFLLSSTLAAGGVYLCARYWGLRRMPACIAAVAFVFNGFLLTRMAIGHLAFHGFGFAPAIAAALLYGIGTLREGRWRPAALLGCLAALLLAMLIYGGIGVALVHTLAVALIMLLICGGFDHARVKAALYCLLCLGAGLLAAAPKIEAVLAMNANFTRDFYPLPGFSVAALPVAWFQSLFWIPAEAALNEGLLNKQFYLGWHELYYGFTPVVPALLIAGLILGYGRLPILAAWRERPFILGLLGLALALAVAVNLYEPHWNRLLKSLPLLGQFSGMTRFFALFIPVVALLLGWIMNQWRRIPPAAVAALAAALALAQYWTLEANLRPGMYYDKVALAPVLAAWPSAADEIPPTREVAIKTETREDGTRRAAHAPYDDHLVIEGKSNALCYEPLFGYRLERYPFKALRPGPIDALDAQGNLNLKNPACYVYPEANECAPGDHFRDGQQDALQALAERGDPGLAVSKRREYANLVGVATLLLIGGFPLVSATAAARRALSQAQRRRRHS